MTGWTAQTYQPAWQQLPIFARSWETGSATSILGHPEAVSLLKLRQNFTLAKFVVDVQYGSIGGTSTKFVGLAVTATIPVCIPLFANDYTSCQQPYDGSFQFGVDYQWIKIIGRNKGNSCLKSITLSIVLSSLDFHGGDCPVPMDDDNSEKTTLVTLDGFHEFGVFIHSGNLMHPPHLCSGLHKCGVTPRLISVRLVIRILVSMNLEVLEKRLPSACKYWVAGID